MDVQDTMLDTRVTALVKFALTQVNLVKHVSNQVVVFLDLDRVVVRCSPARYNLRVITACG